MVATEFLIALLVVEILIYVFHASMLILLFRKKKTTFKGSFYNIFRMVLIADLIYFMCNIFSSRLSLVFSNFFKTITFTASIVYNVAGYFTVVQYLGHLLMAFNRFTLFWFPLKHDWIWQKNWYTYFLFMLPLLHICYRLHEPGEFISSGAKLANPLISSFVLFSSAIIYMVITGITAIFNLLSFTKFYFFQQQSSSTNFAQSNEKTLFGVTCLIFVAQIFRLGYSSGRSLFASNETITSLLTAALPLTMDIFAWTGSLSLLLLSSTVRKEYMKFYTRQKVLKINSSPTVFNII